jgi:hypothetical protein
LFLFYQKNAIRANEKQTLEEFVFMFYTERDGFGYNSRVAVATLGRSPGLGDGYQISFLLQSYNFCQNRFKIFQLNIH